MGMYDGIFISEPIKKKFNITGSGFQTKDFECVLDCYEVNEAGYITGSYDSIGHSYTGTIFIISDMYDGFKRYKLKFINGYLKEVEAYDNKRII